MKSLQEVLNEELISEARQYNPKFTPEDWDKVLNEISRDARGNYSQLNDIEDAVNECDKLREVKIFIDQVFYYGGHYDPDRNNYDIWVDIASFMYVYYTIASYGYRDQYEDINYYKEKILNLKKGNYGIEEEDYYRYCIYNGPSKYIKHAAAIAKYGDCSIKPGDYNF